MTRPPKQTPVIFSVFCARAVLLPVSFMEIWKGTAAFGTVLSAAGPCTLWEALQGVFNDLYFRTRTPAGILVYNFRNILMAGAFITTGSGCRGVDNEL
jgi:hypothetical protein